MFSLFVVVVFIFRDKKQQNGKALFCQRFSSLLHCGRCCADRKRNRFSGDTHLTARGFTR